MNNTDKIVVITVNANNDLHSFECTVSELIKKWKTETDIPTNDDKVTYCAINETRLNVNTFGQLMELLGTEKDYDLYEAKLKFADILYKMSDLVDDLENLVNDFEEKHNTDNTDYGALINDYIPLKHYAFEKSLDEMSGEFMAWADDIIETCGISFEEFKDFIERRIKNDDTETDC